MEQRMESSAAERMLTFPEHLSPEALLVREALLARGLGLLLRSGAQWFPRWTVGTRGARARSSPCERPTEAWWAVKTKGSLGHR